jgi:hypothetical protein
MAEARVAARKTMSVKAKRRTVASLVRMAGDVAASETALIRPLAFRKRQEGAKDALLIR